MMYKYNSLFTCAQCYDIRLLCSCFLLFPRNNIRNNIIIPNVLDRARIQGEISYFVRGFKRFFFHFPLRHML